MEKAIVKIHNDLNRMPLNMSEQDLNFFYAICSQVKEQGTNTIQISFSDLKELTNYKVTSRKRFIEELDRMNLNLMKSTAGLKDGMTRFALFITFIPNQESEQLTVEVHPKYAWMLNDLAKEFTQFELKQFVGLNGIYSKGLYRLIKQWKTVGKTAPISPDELRQLLNTPDYDNKRLMDLVIKPSIEELKKKKAFKNLYVEVKYKKGRGKPVEGYIFHFGKEDIEGQTYFDNAEQLQEIADEMKKPTKKSTKKPKNKFHNFEQRDYDFDELEKKIIKNQ